MKLRHIILRAPDGGGGGGGSAGGNGQVDWKASLPDDLKAHASLATIADVPNLAKSYINAQQLIGAKRIALPPQNATEAQLNEFYNSIGRPESFDKYSENSVKPAEGITVDNAGLTKARETFHKLGLTDSQQKGIMDFYLTGLNEQHGGLVKEIEAARAKTDNDLRSEWGDSFNANYETVKTVIKHFGNEDFAKELDTQLGNSPGLVRMLLKVGTLLQEDKTHRNKFTVAENGPAAAHARLKELTGDAEFQKVLNNKTDPGHANAVELWQEVHRQLS